MRLKILLAVVSVGFAVSPAYAHTGVNAVFSFSSGLFHPLGGLDHLLAMFAVGLLAAQLGGRALWLVPSAFLTAMLGGAATGFIGLDLPGVEYAIALSLLAVALPVALALKMPPALAMICVAIFAIFHGHAHGSELPEGGELFAYVAGFAIATALVHAAGIGFALATKSVSTRLAAAAIGVAGVALLVAVSG